MGYVVPTCCSLPSVSVVSRLTRLQPKYRDSIPFRSRLFCPQSPDQVCCPSWIHFTGYRGISVGLKSARVWRWRAALCSAEIKNAWIYMYIYIYVCTFPLRISALNNRDTCSFSFQLDIVCDTTLK
jgi:hypothetical protein